MISRELLKAKLDQPKINELKNGKNPFNSDVKKMPTNTQMAKNLGSSLVRNIKSVAAGNPLKISDSEANARLNVCKNCEFFNSAAQRCTKCGCHMAVKTYLKAEKCPVGKW